MNRISLKNYWYIVWLSKGESTETPKAYAAPPLASAAPKIKEVSATIDLLQIKPSSYGPESIKQRSHDTGLHENGVW